jgi:hypothetical protein
MNSSIFSFRMKPVLARLNAIGAWLVRPVAWPTLTGVVLGIMAVIVSVMLSLGLLTEPYDTGRVTVFDAPGVRPQGPRTAHASRGRDQAFDAAIFGNSHLQLLEPAALSKASGMQVMSLTVPATGPKEQLVLIDWFLRHHAVQSKRPAKALVIGMDNLWCQSDPALPNEKPFPFWLYDASISAYLRGLLRYELLEEVPRRIGYIMGARSPRASADGWWDYEPEYLGLGYDRHPAKLQALQQRKLTTTMNLSGRYPAIEQLEARLAAVPDVMAIIVRPPVFVTGLALPGSPEASSDTACGDAIAAFAARRARTAFIDWRSERRETMRSDLWFDHTHYRKPVAEGLQRDIATALDLLR